MNLLDISHTQEVYTVSRLNREVRLLLEENFLSLWIEGEISNFAAPQSGHWYFSLKDAAAQVRCAMFKGQNQRLNLVLKDGMHVLARARISLYENRGEFQLLVDHIEEAGIGKLQREFEALKKRLSAAGLFDTAHKKPLPALPRCIGVITSPTGAAIRDILHVLKRRFPAVPVIIYPTLVQGEIAAPDIVGAIQTANRRRECDVLILTRGGGSLEDLWAFNEEIVARAIYDSIIPIISGIGHEIDFTIADFTADMRAPTPSAAAEMVSPNKNELVQSIAQAQKHLLQLLKQTFHQLKQSLEWAGQYLRQQHPKHRLTEQMQRLDFYQLTLSRLQLELLGNIRAKLEMFHAKLDTLSPLATLKRGFAIVTLEKNQAILRSAKQAAPGDCIHLQLMEGSIRCTVIK